MKRFWKTWSPLLIPLIVGFALEGKLFGMSVSPSSPFLWSVVTTVAFTAGGIWWGKRIEREKCKEETASLNEKHREETASLKRMAVVVSLGQPRGITLYSKLEPPLLRLYLYIKTATPLESKDPQAVFYIGGRKIVLKADGLHKLPVSESFKGRGIPLEKILEPAERQALQTLVENHKDVEQIIVSPNLRGDNIEGVPENISFNTSIDVIS